MSTTTPRTAVALFSGFLLLTLAACAAPSAPLVAESKATGAPAANSDWTYVGGSDENGSFFFDPHVAAHVIITDNRPTVFQPCATDIRSPATSECVATSKRLTDAVARTTDFAVVGGTLVGTGDGIELRFAPTPVIDRDSIVGTWSQRGSYNPEVGWNSIIIKDDGSITGKVLCHGYSAHLPEFTSLLVTDAVVNPGDCFWEDSDAFRVALENGFLIEPGGGSFPTLTVLSSGGSAPIIFDSVMPTVPVTGTLGRWELVSATDISGSLESQRPIELEITANSVSGTDGCGSVASSPQPSEAAIGNFFGSVFRSTATAECSAVEAEIAERYLSALNQAQDARVSDGMLALSAWRTELVFHAVPAEG